MIVIEYSTDRDRNNIINNKRSQGLFLIEDKILNNKKELIFSDEPLPLSEPTEIELLQQENQQIRSDLDSAIMELSIAMAMQGGNQ